jgi:hypothetical protein
MTPALPSFGRPDDGSAVISSGTRKNRRPGPSRRNHPAHVLRPYTSTLIVTGRTTVDSGAIRRRLALGLAVLTASGLLAVASPGNAQAADFCSGRKVRTLPFSTGSVWIYKRDGYVCAMTVAKKVSGLRPMSVSVQARGSRPAADIGRYRHHAGPVTVHAGHRCVWVRGSVGSGSVSSGWILC